MSSKQSSYTLNRALRVALLNHGVATVIALMLMLLVPWWLQLTFLYICGILFVTSILAPFIDDWRPKPRISVQRKAVFISGCDSGFGHSLAQRLDDLGLHVFAGCLFPDKDGAQTLKKTCSDRLHVVPLDVTSDDSVQQAAKYVADNIGEKKLWCVVNNAGVAGGAEMAWTTIQTTTHIIDVNTLGVVRVTKAFLPLLCKNKGRVVTVASAAGRYTFPGTIPYCMSKQAAVSFCEGLRMEMYKFGLQVVTVEPWLYKTPLNTEESIRSSLSKEWKEAPSEIKELYPENYLENHKRSTLNFLTSSSRDNPQEVVDCLEEAIMVLDPKYSYNPGALRSRLMFWFLCKLPKQFAEAMTVLLRNF